MRLRRLLWIVPLFLVLALIAGIGFVMTTHTGLVWLVSLADRFAPGNIEYDRLEGRLIGPLALEDFRYRDQAMALQIAAAEFDWEPSALLSATLRINRLKVDGVEVHLPEAAPPPEEPTEPFTLTDIRLPLQVDLQDIAVTDVRIYPATAEQPVIIDKVLLKAETENQTVMLETLQIRMPEGELQADGRLKPVGDYPLTLNLDWNYRLPELGPLGGQGQVSGDLQQAVSITHTLSGAVTAELQAQLREVLKTPAWSAQLSLAIPDPGKLNPALKDAELSARLTTQGSLSDFQADGRLAATLPEVGPLEAEFKTAGNTQTISIRELIVRTPEGPLAIKAQGDLNLAELRFQASGQWQGLAWPLTGQPQVESPRGTFQAEGNLEDYQFTLDTQVQGPNIPQGNWRLEGQGSQEALESATLQGEVLEGDVQAQLSARWQPQVSWQAELSAQGINPGAHWPDLSGRLSLKARNQGKLTGQGLQTTLNLEDFSGTLNDQTLQGKAQLAVDGQDLTIDTLQLAAGKAQLEASGTLKQRWDIHWQLQIPDLARLAPNSAGNLSSTGNIQGPRDQPQANLKLSGDGLVVLDNRIERLRGEAQVDLSGASRSQIALSATDMRLAGQSWEQLSVEGAGTPANHNLQVSLDGDPGRFVLAVNGGLSDTTWQGRLTRLSANGDAFGNWNLAQPVAIVAGPEQASIQQACLTSDPARICLQGQWDQQSGASGRINIAQLPVAHFQQFLPPGIETDTRLNGEVVGSSRPDGAVQATARLELTPDTLRLTATSPPLQVPLREATLRAEVDERLASARLRLDLGDIGQINADVQVQDLQTSPGLDGSIRAEFTDLGLVASLAPQIQNTQGRLVANFDLAGTPTAPQISGQARLDNGAVDIPQTGIQVRDIRLTVASDGQGPLEISGSARSGPGRLQLSGQFDPTVGEFDLNIEGQEFQAANTREIQALISPELDIHFEPGLVRVGGRITIPKAYLSPPQGGGNGRVAVSEDVVIVRAPEDRVQEEEGVPGVKVFASVRIILGDDVRVEAGGFKGNIQGNLLVEQTPTLAPRGTGSIQVQTGEYRIYGQDVEIQRGRILFGGGPINNPGLDLQVAREVGDVTAGARVRGTINTPELQLFSDPAMPDSSILSYLLFGRPPDARSGSENELLLKAALALGLGGGNLVTQKLSDAFGLDYFRFETGDEPTDASLVIGKYLSPNLYVSYGIGILQAVNTFTLRYDITERLSLESTTSGEASGADLIFTIER